MKWLALLLVFLMSPAHAISVTNFNPADNATGVAIDSNLVITFDQSWNAGGGGYITIKDINGTTFQSYDMLYFPTEITGSGTNTLTINPSISMAYSTSYYLLIDSGAVYDSYWYTTYSIADTTTYNWTTESPATVDWYDTSYRYRQKITIDNTKVDANLTDFPIYLNTDDLAAGFYTNAQADCDDVRITKSDGTTEVPREIVFCDGSNGEIHFKATGTLSSSSDTDFYIYYGNPGASDYAIDATYGAENVWNSNYVAVWHNQEDPSGGAPQILDSTANDNDLTSVGSMTSGDLVAGKLSGYALDYDGSDDYLTITDNDTLDTPISQTISLWINTTNTAHGKAFLSKLAPGAGTSGGWSMNFNNAACTECAQYLTYNGTSAVTNIVGSTDISTGGWFMLHGVQEGSTRADLYVNGSNDGSDVSTSGISRGTHPVNQASRGNTGTKIATKIDEARIMSTNMTSTWISTEYNNQSSSSTFYTASAEEEAPVAPGRILFWWNGW